MDKARMNEIKRVVYGDPQKAERDLRLAEQAKRLQSRNWFLPDQGPPDQFSELDLLAMKFRDERLKHEREESERSLVSEESPIRYDAPEENLSLLAENSPVVSNPLILNPSEPEHNTLPELIKTNISSPRKTLDEIVSRHKPILSEPTISEPSLVTMSSPYRKGDNTFIEVLDYFESDYIEKIKVKPVLEERANCILTLVAMLSKISVIIEGKSRSGKSMIMDKCFELLPSYVSLISGSEKSFINFIDEINNKGAIYIHEFQETVLGNDELTAAVKHLSEGKDWRYVRHGEVLSTLSGDTIVCSTGADENKKIQKTDVEILSRFVRLRTRDDEEKNRRICERQDQMEAGIEKYNEFSENRLRNLKTHVGSIVKETCSFENPFAVYFGGEYLPTTQKSVHYRTLYSSLIKSFAKFDKPNRMSKDESNYLVNIEDVYLAYTLYHKTYCDILENLASKSFEALSKNNNTSELNLEKEKEKCEKEIQLIKEKRDKPMDWVSLWQSGYEIVKQNYPLLFDSWVNSQTKNNQVVVYDPIERKDVYLCDAIPALKLEAAK